MTMRDKCHAPAALPPGKKPGTHWGGGWVGPRAGLDGCWKCRPPTGISFCSLSTLSVVLCPDCPDCCRLSLLHNTNIHAPGGIRTRNPSKWSAADPRSRPLGHWDRQGFDPRTVQPVTSRYTDWAMPAHITFLWPASRDFRRHVMGSTRLD